MNFFLNMAYMYILKNSTTSIFLNLTIGKLPGEKD